MQQTMQIERHSFSWRAAFPLLQLLDPGRFTRLVVLSFVLALTIGTVAVYNRWLPLWAATALVLLLMLPAGILKWRDDKIAYGTTVMILSILVSAQGLHTLEHLAQWTQYHGLYWTMRQSSGLLSPANAEWVHFAWNWSVLLAVALLIRGGARNVWMWLLLLVAGFHAIEHTYTFVRYQMVLAELRGLGVENIPAQGLPGIVGRDGWLARSEWTRNTWICGLPGITTAVRLDVHFWWNAIEMVLILAGAHVFLRKLPAFRQTPPPAEQA
jgi:hypothetical protein